MSNDPFQDLFDREIPRNASPASTRATLNALTPQFRRARSRRRSRVGAIAAVAILGSTGGAAALGVGPVALNHRPRTDFTSLANSSAVENLPELQDTTADPATNTIDDLSTPDIVIDAVSSADPNDATPDDAVVGADDGSVETDIVGDSNSSSDPGDSNKSDDSDKSDDSNKSDGSSDSDGSSGSDDPAKSDDSSGSDDPAKSDDSSGSDDPAKSDDSDKSDKPDKSDSNESSSGHGDDVSDPVAGPLTQSLPEGTITVEVDNDQHLVLVGQISPSSGIRFEADLSSHEEIKVKFFSSDTREKLSEVKFHLVKGGITVQVERPSD